VLLLLRWSSFEANPENFFDFCIQDFVLRAGVVPQLVALSDRPGVATISIPEYASRKCGGTLQQRGTSSLLPRVQTASFVQYEVPQTTLDKFMEGCEGFEEANFAVWVDVEGSATKVLAGMKRVINRTAFLKVELEDIVYYEGQSLSSEVLTVMSDYKFDAIAHTDPSPGQFDVLFVNQRLCPL
jgi:FkbM family methyltransferase